MSTGNDNFITLDNIAEIQDIVNGDYMFTISNGVIYKLDFQNFIISKENTDFFTTIDTLSAQVVTNTQSLCSINAYINDTVKPNFGKLDSIYNTINSLSANWDSTYTTINTLSSQSFLPISNSNKNIGSGSLLYYDGDINKFNTLPPGYVNQVLTINKNGLPSFTSASLLGGITNGVDTLFEGSQGFRNSAQGQSPTIDTTKTITVYNTDKNYQFLQLSYNTNSEFTGVNLRQDRWSTTVKVYANNVEVPTSSGIAVMNDVSEGTAIEIRATVKGRLSNFTSAKITLNYNLIGEEVPPAVQA